MPVRISELDSLATADDTDVVAIVDTSAGATRKATPGVVTRAGLQSSGALDHGANAVTNVGLVDGRDVATDGTKLDGIESAATADQSAAEVAFTPSGDIAATDVQAAVVEVRDETDTKLATKAEVSTTVTAGTGLTGGGTLAASRTINVAANIDASIVVNADDVQVGVLATDAQHGVRGGGTQHADATASVDGFATAAQITKLDGIEALADVSPVASVYARTGAVVAAASDYAASQVDNDSTVSGTFVSDALDTIADLASFMVPLYDRTLLLPSDVEITESAGSIVCTLTDEAGALFVTGRWASASHTLVTPATVNLSPGTATVPLLNCVYLTESGGTVTLVNSTTGFADGSIPVAEVYVQSATEVAVHGPIGLHLHADDPTEHIRHIGDRIRANYAQWVSGCGATVTISGASPEDVHIATLVGEAFQFHKHDYPAFDTATGSSVHVVNDSTTAWAKVTNLNSLLTDSAGVSMSARYFSLVFFGIVNQDTGECKLCVNLPGGTYGNSASLDADASKYANYTVPADISGVSFLIAEVHLRHQTSGGGNWTLMETIDLRGLFPALTAGGSATSTSEFSSTVFRVNDGTDSTKQLALDVSALTTSTTRTVTVLDTDATVGQAQSILETTGPTDLALAGVADGQYLRRSGATIIGATPGGSGDVVGPAISTDNALARFDATSGTLLQNGQTIEDDTGNVTVAGNITSGGTVDGRTLGTDGTKLDGIASGAEVNVDVFSDLVFRVQDNADATKQIALEASGITAATTRTITMPDTDVALADIATNTAHAGTGGAAHADATASVDGFATAAQITKLDAIEAAADVTDATNVAAAGAVMDTRSVISGTGLTGGGTLAADRTLNVAANADASIVVNANDVQVGVLATDAQHGVRGGGTQHADATASVDGFATAAQITKLDGIEALAEVNVDVFSDSIWRVQDNTDATKQIAFEASGITTATTRTITMPDFDITLGAIRETTGPTILTLGAVADGEVLTRSGSTIIGGTGGGAGVPQVDYTTSPTSGDHYDAASGVCDGADDFIVSVWYRHPGPDQPVTYKDILRNYSGSTGWGFFWNYNSIVFEAYDGSGVVVTGSPTDFYNTAGYETGRDMIFTLRAYQDASVLTLDFWMNDRRIETQAGANSGMTVSTGTMQLLGAGEGEMAEGIMYYEGDKTAFTDAQLSTYIVDCLEAGSMVAAPSETNRWSAADNAPGGATWTASTGGSNLTETGTTGTQTRSIRVA